ncbi:protein-glutamate O-methyltransferase CheR [candidate division KSB1 bacterium]|nr:protein-glutamate O-methyltransferase CheR [candidate division KSB1 bacterium]
MEQIINEILNFLREQRGYDFTGNRLLMLERRITKRLSPTKSNSFEEYFKYLLIHSEEMDKLINDLTINVSNFFRNPLVWEYLAKYILPILLEEKKARKNNSIRIWSAGCASGEEPYTLAILLKEQLEKENINFTIHIFATDIDINSQLKAEKASFTFEDIKNTKLGLLKKYFIENSDHFELKPEIKKMVKFSKFDLFDNKKYSPPGSIFGSFDIVLCRNVLIYFKPDFQKKIFDKLFRSLNRGGYLVLGEAEVPIEKYRSKFKRFDKCCKIYQKR